MGKAKGEPKMSRGEIVDYIEINQHYMTISEIARATGCCIKDLKEICEKENFEPLTMRERVVEFLYNNAGLSPKEIALKLNISEAGLSGHLKHLGIDPNKPIQQQVEGRTKKKVISSLGTLPANSYLGPIARSYMNIPPPIEIINRARVRLMGK